MDDLISRQALMKEFIDFVRKSNNSDFAQMPTWNDAVSLVGSMPSVKPEQRWIPVTERLPQEETDVLVTVYFHGLNNFKAHIKPKYYTDVASLYDDEWHSYSDEYKIARNRHEVIAWMPLPEPWKGEEDESTLP